VSHRYRVREIAQQAGLSEATVDRVLHNRANVRESTRREVEQAIGDLDKQRSQLRLAGRQYLIDVVMQAPQRFSRAFQAAVEAELPALAPAVVRSRFHFRETGSVPAMVETLDKIGARGSQGVMDLMRAHRYPDTAGAFVVARTTTSTGPGVQQLLQPRAPREWTCATARSTVATTSGRGPKDFGNSCPGWQLVWDFPRNDRSTVTMTTELETDAREESVLRRGFQAAGRVIARTPFTTVVVLAILALGVATGSLWRRITERSWFTDVAYGIPPLAEGKWWASVWGWPFGRIPLEYVFVAIVFALAVGWAEWRLGTVRTAFIAIVGQLVSEVGAFAVIEVMRHSNWEWAHSLATVRHVGVTGRSSLALPRPRRHCAHLGGCASARYSVPTWRFRFCSKARSPTCNT
jgi:hypothetical protein